MPELEVPVADGESEVPVPVPCEFSAEDPSLRIPPVGKACGWRCIQRELVALASR